MAGQKFKHPRPTQQLRRVAEDVLREHPAEPSQPHDVADILKLDHELRVHQIELEMQNQELLSAYAESEESRGKWLDILEFAPIAYLTLSETGLISEINLTGAALLGKERSVLLNQLFFPFIADDYQLHFKAFCKQTLENHTKQTCEIQLRVDAKSELTAEFYAIRATDPLGQKSSIRMAMIDVTERVQTQMALSTMHNELELRIMERTEELQKANQMLETEIEVRKRAEKEVHKLNGELEQRVRTRTAQLEASNKELEGFCYAVAHDLHAPLARLDGYTLALLEEDLGPLDSPHRLYISRIRYSARQLQFLVDALLDWTRQTGGRMAIEEVNLSSIAAETVAQLQQAEPSRNAEFVIAPNIVAMGDPRLLQLVMGKLLDNAWKFTAQRPLTRIEFGAMSQGADRAFFVRDNGAGFEMQYARNLFTPFHRMHSPLEFVGTGMGLATIHRIIARHGGKVWAEAEPEQGATFFFTL